MNNPYAKKSVMFVRIDEAYESKRYNDGKYVIRVTNMDKKSVQHAWNYTAVCVDKFGLHNYVGHTVKVEAYVHLVAIVGANDGRTWREIEFSNVFDYDYNGEPKPEPKPEVPETPKTEEVEEVEEDFRLHADGYNKLPEEAKFVPESNSNGVEIGKIKNAVVKSWKDNSSKAVCEYTDIVYYRMGNAPTDVFFRDVDHFKNVTNRCFEEMIEGKFGPAPIPEDLPCEELD